MKSPNQTKNSVSVIGAGIIGLTSAIALQEAGFRVKIFADKKFDQTLSNKVGAVWFPYSIEPKIKTDRWAGVSYARYLKESSFAKGVSMIPFLNAYNDLKEEEWVKHLPPGTVREATEKELPKGMEKGLIAEVPLAEPPLYLPYLFEKFIDVGGEFELRTFDSLEEMNQLGSFVINCTGLGARALCKDKDLHPMRGQILRTEKMGVSSFADPTKKGALSYIINRSQDAVIGGTDYDNDWNENEDARDTDLILNRLKAFGVSTPPKVLEILVGLRPKRSAVRFQFDPQYPRIFHNYGHGGAGFTVAWGCALELAEELRKKVSFQ
ncbi:D-amino-acid:oxygen oxidoreductase [Algoriphagus ornithinivorans]|uniref:D-amino-acid oxidase n=1 Tax=Algoriphagus ornithinivorans TaxID=226506 RepID=A0A1I5AR19_9BACT|nr:FAD-dependent oxidoreductase [Algoriphagus ornithinivorans]SFN64822.1 D-amino-acid:oxygen oxidoreductase [Algoriphagus ornithinivorans]